MFTTRVRLTAAFAAGMIVVSIAVMFAFWTARNANVYHDIGQYTIAQADLAVRILSQNDEVIVGPDGAALPAITPRAVSLLRLIPDYLIVVDKDGHPIYQSDAVRRLSPSDSALLHTQLLLLPDTAQAGLLDLYGADSTLPARGIVNERLLLVARSVPNSPNGAARVIAASPTLRATTLPHEFTIVVTIMLPIIIGVTTWIAYLILGRSSRQLDQIAREVAAITDGRSLHRRLAMDESSSEFARLGSTLNAMIARLETSFSGLRRFTADASHELKTPLAVLRADVERAMSDNTVPSEKLVAMEEALQEITRMSDLVESLLTLARADEGRFDIHREPVELKPLVLEVFETAHILGEAAGVTVNLPFTADVTIQGDRTRLRQLFLNLITNAIKYTPPGGRVDIGLGRHPDNVTFAVRDTGIGIAAADVPHIFERFWRADRARSRMSERGGFGLGLAISQWIAQAHGGTLTASSRLGRGSLFTITLPVPPEEKTDAQDTSPILNEA